MPAWPTVDGVLVQWGERLFYPPSRIVKHQPWPRLDTVVRRKAPVIRGRIAATDRRAPQVMVKVTGGGRGMAAIAAHFRYISKNGRLPVEDDRGVVRGGKESLKDLVDQWRYGGALIPEEGHRREAFNIMLSMPHGTDARIVQSAAREFASHVAWTPAAGLPPWPSRATAIRNAGSRRGWPAAMPRPRCHSPATPIRPVAKRPFGPGFTSPTR